ncbi:MAG: helix-turn-helix domain-containing protein [Rhodospirillales bacterium]|nr:MAG: helix-turn-helix domain-containing protein [Rhodospirillales bacterium]
MTSQPPARKPKRGRPDAYRPEYAQQLIDFCADGWSLTAAAHHLGVTRRQLYSWAERHDDFAYAMDRARAAACAWYEGRLRERTDGQGTPKAAIFGVMNLGRDDWREAEQGPSVVIQLATNVGASEQAAVIDAQARRLGYDISGGFGEESASDGDSQDDAQS